MWMTYHKLFTNEFRNHYIRIRFQELSSNYFRSASCANGSDNSCRSLFSLATFPLTLGTCTGVLQEGLQGEDES